MKCGLPGSVDRKKLEITEWISKLRGISRGCISDGLLEITRCDPADGGMWSRGVVKRLDVVENSGFSVITSCEIM